jgi:hypothetical protein
MSKSIKGLTIEELKIKLHPCLNNYDINIHISGYINKSLKELISPYSLSLNFQSTFFKQLSKAVERATNDVCTPLKLTPHIKKVDIEDFNEYESKFQIEMHLGMPEYLCQFTLTKFIAEMNELAKEDALIELTFMNHSIDLFSVFTKPSLIAGSIEHNESALWSETIPEDIRRVVNEPIIARGSFFQILCIILVWALCINSDLIMKRFPCLFSENGFGLQNKLLSEYDEKDLTLSILENKLIELKKQDKIEEMKPVITEIEELFDVKNITLEEVEMIKNKLWEQIDWERSLAMEICRVIKVVWFAILGWILYFCFNFVYAVEFFMEQSREIRRNHKPNLFGILTALVSSAIIFIEFPFLKTAGVVFGCAVLIGFYYSSFLHSLFTTYKYYILYTITIFTAFHPINVYSTEELPLLLNWFFIFQYHAILSNIISNWVYNYVGLSQEYLIVRFCIDSLLLQMILIGSGVQWVTMVESFRYPIITVSTLLSVCLLIVARSSYVELETKSFGKISYLKKQLVVILHLASCVLGGYGLGINGLLSVGYVFSAFYIIQKVQDLYYKLNGNKQAAFNRDISSAN